MEISNHNEEVSYVAKQQVYTMIHGKNAVGQKDFQVSAYDIKI